MRHLLFVSLVAACATDAEEPTVDNVHARSWDKCPDWGCGLNSPNIRGKFFHELNLKGVPNLEGFTVGTARKGGTTFNLDVVDGELKGKAVSHMSPGSLVGDALVDLEITLHRGSELYYLTVTEVAHQADYWARPTRPTYRTQDPPRIESYKFMVREEGSAQASPLCGASSETASDRIPNNHAVLFEGERITAATKTVADDSRYWFNIGCAGTALAKLHLTGRTEAAQSVGFATDIDDRQAMLKMLVGDYCGTGRAFTVQGQPLMWRDDQGTIDMPTSPASELEAAWTADGAWCLSTPRLVKHPSAASAAKFPEGVEAAILAECGTRPRRCGEWLIVTPLRSYNPL